MLRCIAAVLSLMLLYGITAFQANAADNICQALAAHYDDLDKRIASDAAEDYYLVASEEPKRAPIAIKVLHGLVEKLLLVEQLKGHGCPFPATLGHHEYMDNAIDCARAVFGVKLKVELGFELEDVAPAPECDKDNWKRTSGVGPWGRTVSGGRFDRCAGLFLLEAVGAQVSKSRV